MQDKTLGLDEMLQYESLSVIVGIRRVAQHAAGVRTMDGEAIGELQAGPVTS